MKAILDTSVVIATDLAPIEGQLAISAATVAELHYGILVARSESTRSTRLSRLSVLLRKFDALPINESVAASYGVLAARVAASDRQPPARSTALLIAATAHAHHARLYTRNAKDFAGLDDLVEVVPI